jgi:hypothetical protein
LSCGFVQVVAPSGWTLVPGGLTVQPSQYSYTMVTSQDLQPHAPRGSEIIVGKQRFRISAGGTYTASLVTLDSMYLHPTPGSPLPVYTAGTAEAALTGTGTGTYVVTYLPLIRGTYRLDVTLPPVAEVVRIRIGASTALAGDYYIKIGDQTAGPFLVSASANTVAQGLTGLSNIVGPVRGACHLWCAVVRLAFNRPAHRLLQEGRRASRVSLSRFLYVSLSLNPPTSLLPSTTRPRVTP